MKYKTLNEFTEITASKAPTPGGGGVSGLVGSLAVSLSEMVTSLTEGKKKYAEYEEEIQTIKKECEELRIQLLDSIDEDANAFYPLSKAYSMDKEDPNYHSTLEKCLKDAAASPFNILKLVTRVIELDERLAIIGSKLAVSDAGTSVMLALGALYGALINIKVNTRLMADKEYANNLEGYAQILVDEYSKRAYLCYEKVMERLNG